jgi:hypothetical protein
MKQFIWHIREAFSLMCAGLEAGRIAVIQPRGFLLVSVVPCQPAVRDRDRPVYTKKQKPAEKGAALMRQFIQRIRDAFYLMRAGLGWDRA